MSRTIILRGHAETRQKRRAKERTTNRKHPPKWPTYALVFDCETRCDEKQSLTFGFARLLQDVNGVYSNCRAEIIFYDPEEAKPYEVRALKQYIAHKRAEIDEDVFSKDIVFLTRQEFIRECLFPHVDAGSLIVGFNLPFDLSRLASYARSATRVDKDWSLVSRNERSTPDTLSFSAPEARVSHGERLAVILHREDHRKRPRRMAWRGDDL